MACGCKGKVKNKNNLISKGKKVVSNKNLPLITVRKKVSK